MYKFVVFLLCAFLVLNVVESHISLHQWNEHRHKLDKMETDLASQLEALKTELAGLRDLINRKSIHDCRS